MVVGVQVPLRVLRTTLKRGVQILRESVSARESTRIIKQVHTLFTTHPTGQHYTSRIKVSSRWYSTSVRQLKNASGDAVPRISVRAAVSMLGAPNPLGSTLRPRLVGGAMPWRAGGSVRYFSHTPAAPAKALSQLSIAFAFNGAHQVDHHQRAGTDWLIGIRAQLSTSMRNGGSGAYVDFNISPHLGYISTLESPELFESLNAGRKSLVAVTAELEKLGMLGNLTTTRPGPTGGILRVHFSGCSKGFVENICEELGVQQGVVHENETFIFPGLPDYEPSESSASFGSSTYSKSLYSEFTEPSIELEPITTAEPPESSQTLTSSETSETSAFSTYLESPAYFEDDEEVFTEPSIELEPITTTEPPESSQTLTSSETSETSAFSTYLESPAYFEDDEEDFEDEEEIDFYTTGDPEYQEDDDYPSDSEPEAVGDAPSPRFSNPESPTGTVVTSEIGQISNHDMRPELALYTQDNSMVAPAQSAYNDRLPSSDLRVVGVNSESHLNLETLEGAAMMPEVDWRSDHYASLRTGAAVLTPDSSVGTPAQSVYDDHLSGSEPEVIIDTPTGSTGTLEWSI